MKVLYILMRTDLPSMNAGKAIAQGSHASNAMVQFINRSDNNIFKQELIEWADVTSQGFGTCLVLGADITQIDNIVRNVDSGGYVAGKVLDPTYPFFVTNEIANLFDEAITLVPDTTDRDGNVLCLRQEFTCAYLFGEKDSLAPYVSDLKLHP